MDLHMRSASTADSEVIATLSGQLGYPATSDQVRARVGAILPRSDDAIFVAEFDGEVVGWIHIFGTHRIESEPFIEIGGLVVADSQRGRGVGKALIDAGEEWASAKGYSTIRLRTNVLRNDAHRFYERIGYSFSKQQAVFVKHLAGRRAAGGA